MRKKKLSRGMKIVLEGMPLAAAVAGSFLPLQNNARQALILAILIWVQVFFLFDSSWLIKQN